MNTHPVTAPHTAFWDLLLTTSPRPQPHEIPPLTPDGVASLGIFIESVSGDTDQETEFLRCHRANKVFNALQVHVCWCLENDPASLPDICCNLIRVASVLLNYTDEILEPKVLVGWLQGHTCWNWIPHFPVVTRALTDIFTVPQGNSTDWHPRLEYPLVKALLIQVANMATHSGDPAIAPCGEQLLGAVSVIHEDDPLGFAAIGDEESVRSLLTVFGAVAA